MNFHRVRYSRTNEYYVRVWLTENCTAAFYTGTDWGSPRWKETFLVEFESEQDALLFTLRWGV